MERVDKVHKYGNITVHHDENIIEHVSKNMNKGVWHKHSRNLSSLQSFILSRELIKKKLKPGLTIEPDSIQDC